MESTKPLPMPDKTLAEADPEMYELIQAEK